MAPIGAIRIPIGASLGWHGACGATIAEIYERVRMAEIGLVCCIVGVVLAAAAAFMAYRQPNRIANGFALELGLVLIIGGFGYLMAADPSASEGSLATCALVVVYYARYVIYVALGVGLVANGVFTVRREGLSLTHILPFIWGFLLIGTTYWFLEGPGMYMSGSQLFVDAMVFLSFLIAYIPFALLGVLLSNEICYRLPKKPETEYVIVLGCGILPDGGVTPLLRGRLDAAIAAYEAGGRKAKIIVSGGQGADEIVSEARAMANYLRAKGIDEGDIILEDESRTTEENLRNSLAIMNSRGGVRHCTIATSSYHCLRAAMFARRLGINASCVGGRTAAFYYPAAFFREYVALIMKNRYAVALFVVLAAARFGLYAVDVLPEGLF